MNDEQSHGPGAAPRKSEAKKVARQTVEQQHIQNFLEDLRQRHPCRKSEEVKQQLRVRVVQPFQARQIDEAEAERIWTEIAAAHPVAPAPAAPAPQAPQPPPTASQAPLTVRAPDTMRLAPRPTEKGAPAAAAAPPPAQPTSRPPATVASGEGVEAAEAPVEAPPVEPPPPPPKPAWKVLEPEDRSDSVEHEAFECVPRDAEWSIMAASVRGKLHAHRGLWRDDAFAYDWVDDWTILAVSDGAGSASISRVAAKIACDESVKTLKELLTGYRPAANDQGEPSQNDLFRIRSFLIDAAQRAQIGVLREAQERKCDPRNLHATLLLTACAPVGQSDLAAAIQVGDGAAAVFTADGACTLLGTPDHGEYSSETRFLTTPNIERGFLERVVFAIKRNLRCLAVMCDGVSDDFFPESKRLVELFNGDPIPDLKTADGEPVRGVMLDVVNNPRGGESLRDWLKYEKKGSSDDRTLVLLYRSGS